MSNLLLRHDFHSSSQYSVSSFKLNFIHKDSRVSRSSRMNAHIIPGARPLYRSVFVSDTHLGTRGARCDFLADFLRRTTCQNLFLVGDIIDGWRLRKSWYWDE